MKVTLTFLSPAAAGVEPDVSSLSPQAASKVVRLASTASAAIGFLDMGGPFFRIGVGHARGGLGSRAGGLTPAAALVDHDDGDERGAEGDLLPERLQPEDHET